MVEIQARNSADVLQSLYAQLGKELVDKALFSTLWLDETLDIAERPVNGERINTISPEILNILSDVDAAISVSKTVFSYQEVSKKYDQYFWSLWINPSIEDVSKWVVDMMQSLVDRVKDENISAVDCLSDFYLLFIHDHRLKQGFPGIFGSEVETIGDYTSQISNFRRNLVKSNKVWDLFIQYMSAFYDRFSSADEKTKLIIFFIYESFRKQSGKREGIGNSLNPMVLWWHIDGYFWSFVKDENPIKNAIKNIAKLVPWTIQYQEKKLGKKLDKIIEEIFFPRRYLVD